MGWFRRRRQRRQYTEKGPLISGVQFYTFRTFDYTVVNRFNAFVMAQAEAANGVSDQDLDRLQELLTATLNEGRHMEAAQVVGTLTAVRKQITTHKALFRIADPLILLPDEPVTEMSAEHTRIKAQLFEHHDQIRAFFFSTAMRSGINTGDLSSTTEIADYLKEHRTEAIERMFSVQIEYKNWADYLVESTPK